MVTEISADRMTGSMYISNYLNDTGKERWPDFLIEAATSGSDATLAEKLRVHYCFLSHHQKRKPKGGYTLAEVPKTAPETLSEGQFNLYYMRALAIRALGAGVQLRVYRAKQVMEARHSSELLISTDLDPAEVLEVLRATKGVNPPINIPLPNSGLSLELIT